MWLSLFSPLLLSRRTSVRLSGRLIWSLREAGVLSARRACYWATPSFPRSWRTWANSSPVGIFSLGTLGPRVKGLTGPQCSVVWAWEVFCFFVSRKVSRSGLSTADELECVWHLFFLFFLVMVCFVSRLVLNLPVTQRWLRLSRWWSVYPPVIQMKGWIWGRRQCGRLALCVTCLFALCLSSHSIFPGFWTPSLSQYTLVKLPKLLLCSGDILKMRSILHRFPLASQYCILTYLWLWNKISSILFFTRFFPSSYSRGPAGVSPCCCICWRQNGTLEMSSARYRSTQQQRQPTIHTNIHTDGQFRVPNWAHVHGKHGKELSCCEAASLRIKCFPSRNFKQKIISCRGEKTGFNKDFCS